MSPEKLKQIISRGENAHVKFYKTIPSGEELAQMIVGFSNKDGGTIIVGVDTLRRPNTISSGGFKAALAKAESLIVGTPYLKSEAIRVDSKRVIVVRVAKGLEPLSLMTISSLSGRNHRNQSENKNDNKDHASINFKNPESEARESQFNSLESAFWSNTIADDLSDNRVAPCFSVDSIAKAFYKLLRQSSFTRDNVCFLGVFGKWGRGKSFFLKRLKEIVKDSDEKECFDFVVFNAWKYQDTPGIWAHLVHTLIRHKSGFGRLRYKITWRMLLGLLGSILMLLVSAACFLLVKDDIIKQDLTATVTGIIGGTLSLTASIIGFIKSVGQTSLQGHKNFKATDLLGIQYEIEKELEKIVRRWNIGHFTNIKSFLNFNCGDISEKYKRLPSRKIVLVVEDIDRCNDNKMIETIEALKLIMENPVIARKMIALVAVDADKLITAYRKRFESSDDAYLMALEQMNKLFLMGIKLPKIPRKDMGKYIDALAEQALANVNPKDNGIMIPDQPLNSLESIEKSRDEMTEEESTGDSDEDNWDTIDSDQAVNMIASILKKKVDYGSYRNLSPRQVRILFYRLELANNLLTDYYLPATESVFSTVLNYSLESFDIRECGYSKEMQVIEMVVPYPVSNIGNPSQKNTVS